jgi:hypothetical protein
VGIANDVPHFGRQELVEEVLSDSSKGIAFDTPIDPDLIGLTPIRCVFD